MLLFMPFGMIFGNVFVCKCKELVCLVSGLVVSLLIECTQLLYSIGTFEIDDLIINTWGAVIGCAVVNTIIKKNKNVLDNLTTLSPLLAFCVVVFAFCVGPVFKEIL